MTKPLFSIIIPVYGRIDFVRQAIRSIEHQTVPSSQYEIIIVEERDYGLNIRAEIKKEFPNVITLVNKGKEGPGGSRNTGIVHARGIYICFLDSDDCYSPTFLQQLLSELESHTETSAAICLSKTVFEKGFNIKERLKLYPLITIRDVGLLSGYIFHKQTLFSRSFYLCQISHMMFRATCVRNLQFQYDYRRGGEDWNFFVDTLARGPIRIVPKRLLQFRYAPGSSTDSVINRKNKWKAYTLLASRLPQEFKKGLFYWLFLKYIALFGGTYEI